MDPFGDPTSESSTDLVVGNSCQAGAEIILKRIFKKLFNQVNALQPSELDEEFFYQSSITYDDYLEMVKQVQNEQVSCASLNRLENILSNFMSNAVVKRPMHTSLFSDWFLTTGPMDPMFGMHAFGSLNLHLLTVLFVVGLTTWLFRYVAGIRSWRAFPLSVLLVGFIEFCIHKNELLMHHRLNLERCKNPSTIARIASWLNYDYDGCRSSINTMSLPNIAFTCVEYLSELTLQPLVHFGHKVGLALQSYLNSFTGWNFLLAPLLPIILASSLGVIITIVLHFGPKARQPAMQYNQMPLSGQINCNKNNNMIENHR